MSQEDMDADDILLGASRASSPAAKFPSIGSVVAGYVTAKPRKTEQRDVDGKPKTFDDGTVRMQVLIELKTNERSPDIVDDDGSRTLWCKWEIQKAVSQAMIDAGVRRIEVGGYLEVGRSHDLPPAKRGYKPTQTFVAKYTPPSQVAADDALYSAAQPAAAPVLAGPPVLSGPPAAAAPVTARPATTLDQLKATSFDHQGNIQGQEPPF